MTSLLERRLGLSQVFKDTSLPEYAEVVVNRLIARHRVTPIADQAQAEERREVNPLAVTFSYAVPQELRAQVALGQLVEVPFRSDTLQAVIVGLGDHAPPLTDIRPLSSILETTPVISPSQLELAHWLSMHYLAPLSECVWPFLPPGIRRLPQVVVEAVPGKSPPRDIDARAAALFHHLQRKGATPVNDLEADSLKALSDLQLVRTRQRLAPPRMGPQIDRTVELTATAEEVATALPTLGHASKQADVLLYLQSLSDPLPTVADVLAAVGCGRSVLGRLADRGWVKMFPRRTLVALCAPVSDEDMERAQARLDSAPVQQAALVRLRDQPGPVAAAGIGISTSVLAALEKKGYCRRWTEPESITLTLDPDEVLPAVLALRDATLHAKVLDMLAREEGRVWAGWVYVQPDATLDTLKHLAATGLVSVDESPRGRDPLSARTVVLEEPPQLTPEQEEAWETIATAISQPTSEGKAFLLHGVTGSGKTEVYLRAIAEALQRGQGAIVLVPEIALAAQTINRVAVRFPDQVAVWHSDLSLGQRFDTWQRVRDGELRVVVGARSALFAPVPDLGLIVLDEEHEPAYKAGRAPRYHARDAALHLGRLTGATVILGSATPDVTTFRRAQRHELTLLPLPYRVLAHCRHLSRQAVPPKAVGQPVAGFDDIRTLPLPPVEVVDLSQELKAGNPSIFSRSLQDAIRDTLAADQQVILFLNRRGTATFVLCRDCGHVMTCSRCQMSLTFHAADEALICHHCNRRQANPNQCPVCQTRRIRYFGLGTERVEAAVRDMFPTARPLRWDRDTARARGSHEAFLSQFVEGQANVLIGTQMIAKGLDMPRVTLVGVISADTALFLPDFRAAERTFQLLVQVAGRAGRSPLGGRVIIQTYHPELPLIRAAAAHDYGAFCRNELVDRHQGHYPPFKRLARLVFTGSGARRAEEEAEGMAQTLKAHSARQGEPGVEIVGPAPCFYGKLRGQHRWHIVIRANEPEAVLRPITLPLGWRVDVDPTDFL